MKKLLSLLLTAIVFCGCVPKANDLTKGYERQVSIPISQPAEVFNATQTDFAVNLIKQNFKKNNVLISPLSVKIALAMTLNGAENETKKQMENLLGMTCQELNEDILKYTSSLTSTKKAKFHIANSIWLRDYDFTVKDEFLQATVNYYGAGIFKEPFDNSTVKKINVWVKENTDGMIKEIIHGIEKDTIMYLINALAFDAEWLNIYEESDVRDGQFTSINKEKQKAEMMSSTEYSYLEDDFATGFIKGYHGNYAFVALLPKGDIESYIDSLNGNAIENILKTKENTAVHCKLPKFSLDYDVLLNDSLINMGMSDAFSKDNADFSKMSDYELYIDSVIHKTHITVDEKGTKAGAVTAVVMKNASMPMDKPKEVILDRPFVYMIIDTTNNLPLFMGVLTEIK